MPVEQGSQGLAADAQAWSGAAGQVSGELAQRPAGEGLAELGRAGRGRVDDEVFLVRGEQAGTASRPFRVQAVQSLVVEGVDDLAHGLFVSGDQASYDRDGVAAGRGQDDHRPPVADRVGAAPADDALEFLALRVGESAGFEGCGHRGSQDRLLSWSTLTPITDPSERFRPQH